MARFDVFALDGSSGYLLDVQANLLSALNTRVVVPLIPIASAPVAAERLNPRLRIHDIEVSMVTQFMAAVPRSELRTATLNLEDQASAILEAIDFLHQGW